MEIRDFALAVVSSQDLGVKLRPAAGELSDDAPGPAWRAPAAQRRTGRKRSRRVGRYKRRRFDFRRRQVVRSARRLLQATGRYRPDADSMAHAITVADDLTAETTT